MILKRITIIGFKSFADRVDMVLNQGITALVGPNGCGKSNVVDAVRWVLGEQSIKVLRGGKNEDVIFNGCDSRKPLGMAEVSLTFDNSSGKLPIDFNEVSITRRLFRNGESQYLINKTICRLKDVHQLFMDTGIGTSTYSIIEQGEMDWIINAKPIERREIFEEAAGITKFKVKKKEAERKLKYTEDNLLRLGDIINELNVQINSMGRQAAKAKRFKKLNSELQFLDGQNTLRQYLEYEKNIQSSRDELQESGLKIEQIKSLYAEEEASFQKESEEMAVYNQQEKSLTERKFDLDNQLNQIKQAVEFKKARIQDIESRLADENSGREVHEQKFNELESMFADYSNQKSGLQEIVGKKQKEVDERGEFVNQITQEIEDRKKFIQEFKQQLDDLKNKSMEAQNKLIEYEILEKNLDQQIEKQSDELSDLQLNLNFEDDQLAMARDKVTQLKTDLEIISKNLLQKEEEYKHSQKALSDLESSMMKFSSELTEKSSRKKALEDLKSSYEGFLSGVKAIMMKKKDEPDSWSGIVGVLPDIIKVKPGYEIAAEAALGSRIQNIIVEKGEDAKQAINFLKQYRLGRVTFLPLDLIRSRENPLNVPSDQRIVGRMLEFIDFESRFNGILDSLLGNYLVVKNMDDGIGLLRQGLKGFNLITLEGEMLSGSGAITGGEIKTSVKGIFSRENEIDELEHSVSQLRDSLIRCNENRNHMRNTIDRVLGEFEKLKIDRTTFSSDVQHAEKDMQKAQFQREAIQKRFELLYAEIEKAQQRKTEILEKRKTSADTLQESSTADNTIRESILNYERELELSYNRLTDQKENWAREKTEFSNSMEKLESVESRIRELKKEIEERKNWLKGLDSNQSEQKRIMEQLRQEIGNAQEQIQAIVFEDEKVQTELESVLGKINSLKGLIQTFEEKRKNVQTELDTLQNRITHLKVTVAETEGKMNSQREYIYAKYQVRIENLEAKFDEVKIPWEEVHGRISEIEETIKSLGQVNLSAIEELEKLQERQNFLVAQEKDLNAAKVQLNDVIQKINTTAGQMFQETFEKVKVYFNDIFVELFEGGKAELRLVDNEDMLEAGVEIVARPSGKHPQTISLLSGGEKCLTATALLFALFKVKASPFCIVDELDAPLDESNIGRFTKMLKSFSGSTQFIVITHNKKSIKIADLLYGVTQPEKGVSKLISVKFIDDNLDHLLLEPEASKAIPKIKGVIQLKEDDELSQLQLPEVKPVVFDLPLPQPNPEEGGTVSVNRLTEVLKEIKPDPVPEVRAETSAEVRTESRIQEIPLVPEEENASLSEPVKIAEAIQTYSDSGPE